MPGIYSANFVYLSVEEITFNIEKPYTEKEIQDFKEFRIGVKSLLKKGKLKVVERFKVFSFIIVDYTSDEKNDVTTFLNNENHLVKIASGNFLLGNSSKACE